MIVFKNRTRKLSALLLSVSLAAMQPVGIFAEEVNVDAGISLEDADDRYAGSTLEDAGDTVYTVTYMDGGLTVSSENIPSENGISKLYSPTKEGYNFLGWYDSTDPTKAYVTSIPGTTARNVVLVAEWEQISYSVIYHLSGNEAMKGKPEGAYIDGNFVGVYVPSEGLDSLPEAELEGKIFDGWYNNKEFTGNKVTSIAKGTTGEMNLYPKFSEPYKDPTYTIAYDISAYSGAKIEATNYAKEYVSTNGITGDQMAIVTLDGYDFAGWFNNKELTGNAWTYIPVGTTGNIVFYPKFTKVAVTREITYVLNNGTNSPSNDSIKSYVEGVGVPTIWPATRAGYKFDGWYTDANFTENRKVTGISKETTGNVILYAKWTAQTYNIVYHLNEGRNSSANPSTYTFGKGVSKLYAAEKEWPSFDGWYSDANFVTRITSIPTNVINTAHVYAKFTDLKQLKGAQVLRGQRKNGKITLKWEKYDKNSSRGYLIYCRRADIPTSEFTLVKTLTDKSDKTWTHKDLNSGTDYEYRICAYKKSSGEKVPVAVSPTLYVNTKGGSYSVANKIRFTKVGDSTYSSTKNIKYTARVGVHAQISANEVGKNSEQIKVYRTPIYRTSNKNICTVTPSGNIVPIKKGSCKIYAYAQNGLESTIRVKVKN
ncbi:MAG: InlB B-repeat-containing protein [Lachnospiraceae bacterium]|nr:InlB B-repeat-containing protein [Lachnospiraceae bacterium]